MDYFLTPDGDDSASGDSPRQAWRTLERANRQTYSPGDRLQLRGGATFTGGLTFTTENVRDGREGRRPITIESYGGGKATIEATATNGIFVQDLGGFVVKDLNLVGRGRGRDYCGVHFYNTRRGAVKLPYVRVENIEASGFGGAGIQIGAYPEDISKSGYRDVQVTHCIVHGNAYHGIHIWGAYDEKATAYANENVVISHCIAHDNLGDPDYRENHSGNGIILSDTDGGRIEYCTAYGNGALCNSKGGGPVGIWTHASNRIVIQFCASFNNRTGRSTDGGGFDFDGGVSNSLMQYNYSGGNDGAGYLLYAYYGAPYRFRGNVVRYNISENDGRRNAFGMIHLATGGPEIRDIGIYHNTIITSPTPSGTPSAILLADAAEVRLGNNLLVTEGGIPLLELNGNLPGFRALGNAYWSRDARFVLRDAGKEYRSLSDWRNATGRETLAGRDTGIAADPHLDAYRLPQTPLSAAQVARMKAFRPRTGSPLIAAGADISAVLGAVPSLRDFTGKRLAAGRPATVGANEPE